MSSVRDPIEALLREHVEIMAELRDLRRVLRDLDACGDAAMDAALETFASVGRMMATRLALHARKEDEALFPPLEAILGVEGTPTTAMRREHEAIHARAALYRKTLHELNAVEHPAIEHRGAALRALAAGGGTAAELRRVAEEILRLLDGHFEKEEQVLFPMARHLLSPEALQEITCHMDAIEEEAVGRA